MNKFLLFAVFCVAAANCVELENLCSSDAFEYEGVLVNAFHRVQWNTTFQSLLHYLINNTVWCDLDQFQNKTNFLEAYKLKRE